MECVPTYWICCHMRSMIGSLATGKDDYLTRTLDSIRARSLGLFTPV